MLPGDPGFTPGGARPGPRMAGRAPPARLDRLGGGPDRHGGQGDEDAEPDHQADGQPGRYRDVPDHIGADLDGLVGGRELADLAEEAAQREPQAAEDGEDEVDDQGDRLD